MAGKKTADNCKIPFWLSTGGRAGGRYIQVGNSFFLHNAVKDLSNAAFRLYVSMALESGGRPAFIFPKAAAAKYGLPASTFRRAADELITKGFIRCTVSGKNLRKPNEYQFVEDWKRG